MTPPRSILVVALLMLSAGCGDGVATDVSSGGGEEWRPAALEYAADARRALLGTRYEALGDALVADLLVELCTDLGNAPDPEGLVDAAIAEAGGSGGDPVEEEIFAEVVAAGLASTCPEVVAAASTVPGGGGDPVDAFVAVVAPVAAVLGGDAPRGDQLVEAGGAVCQRLDEGASGVEAGLAGLEVLFAIPADGTAGDDQVEVAGAVLAAAVTHLCPEHFDAVSGSLMETDS